MERPTDLVKPKVAAKKIGVSVDALYRRIHRGELRSWLLGKRFFVSEAAVLNLFTLYEPPGVTPLPTRAEREQQVAAANQTLREAGALAG